MGAQTHEQHSTFALTLAGLAWPPVVMYTEGHKHSKEHTNASELCLAVVQVASQYCFSSIKQGLGALNPTTNPAASSGQGAQDETSNL